uniref:Uncharacterized protein n=1 Tax=Timema bartmani TaxID=61472 RepID=A0A7R9F434_9NEOP|nr:unnamed protein product [Timema bartmani]
MSLGIGSQQYWQWQMPYRWVEKDLNSERWNREWCLTSCNGGDGGEVSRPRSKSRCCSFLSLRHLIIFVLDTRSSSLKVAALLRSFRSTLHVGFCSYGIPVVLLDFGSSGVAWFQTTKHSAQLLSPLSSCSYFSQLLLIPADIVTPTLRTVKVQPC